MLFKVIFEFSKTVLIIVHRIIFLCVHVCFHVITKKILTKENIQPTVMFGTSVSLSTCISTTGHTTSDLCIVCVYTGQGLGTVMMRECAQVCDTVSTVSTLVPTGLLVH